MPKRFRTTRRRKSTKRARRARRPKQMNRMQRTALSYVRKKYTVVLPLIAQEGQNAIAGTISHIGGRNGSNPSDTITLTSANPDNMASEDMSLYQYFKISGVGYKLFFPEGTTPQATPVQWSLAYSANNVLNPALTAGPFQSLATFQTSSCSAKNPVKRYFNTASTLKRLGIEWCNTDEYSSFGNTPPSRPLR